MESFEQRPGRAASLIHGAERVAAFPGAAHSAGAKLTFINRTETPWDHIAEVRFVENAAEVLGRIMDVLGSV